MRIKNFVLAIFLVLFSIGCVNKNKEKTENSDKNIKTEEQISSTGNDKNSNFKEDEIKYETYCNGRFGFCIDYPLNVLYPQGESENGDGQVFMSKNSENTLWVYRDYRDNVNPKDPFDISAVYNEDTMSDNPEYPQRVITYKHLGKNYYVVSGFNNGKIFYQKTIYTKDGLATALIEYSESEKSYYDKVAEQIFNTFKWHEHTWIDV